MRHTIHSTSRTEAAIAVVALAAALLTFQTWRPGPAIAAAVLIGLSAYAAGCRCRS